MTELGPALLWTRAALLSAVAILAGTLAHITAAGRIPGPVVFVLLALVTTAGSASLLTRPAGRVKVVLLTAAGQAWVHAVLTMTAGHRGDPHATTGAVTAPAPPVVPAHRPATYADVYEATRPQVGSDDGFAIPAPLMHLVADMTGAHAPMMALHMLAASAVGLWLAVGETALWALVAALSGVVAVVVLRPLPPLPRRTPVPDAAPVPHPQHVIARCVVRRGPPALLAD